MDSQYNAFRYLITYHIYSKLDIIVFTYAELCYISRFWEQKNCHPKWIRPVSGKSYTDAHIIFLDVLGSGMMKKHN